jgi:uncharacterized protein (TIGR03435 family)
MLTDRSAAIGILGRASAMALTLFGSAVAQEGASGPAFDVASVKPTTLRVIAGRGGVTHLGVRSDNIHGLFGCDYCSLNSMIGWSYEVKSIEIVGPVWVSEDTYQVEARMTPGSSLEQSRQMVRRLLATRFWLKVHREQRMVPGYELVADSKPKIEQVETSVNRFGNDPGVMDYAGISMAGFAHFLSARMGAPVVDNTGLSGFYRIKMKWDPSLDKGPDSAIFEALGTLGLKLKGKKMEMSVIVIDTANRTPTPN